ncbi:MAG: RluA family pseudouridine synthase [Dermabacter sp.]|nr:RluA family pseudouridine synthase [Dermabacter sp.]
MSTSRLLFVPDGLEGERVDVGVSRMLGLSRTKAAELVSAGHVLVEGRAPSRSERLLAGIQVEVTLPDERDIADIVPDVVEGMDIVYEDADIVVVNKPVGVAAHPSVGWDGPTVLGHLLGAGVSIATSGAQERRGIVSRLDVGTSGLMVVAKSEVAYAVLKDAFRRRLVSKRYHAVCQGHPDPLEGTIDAPIGRSKRHDFKFAIMSTGKAARTHYEVAEMFAGAALCDVLLETGRTHQIRVHFAALGHPLVGDPLYGADPALAERLGLARQWLHARELSFEHPTRHERVSFEAPYSDDLSHALEVLRGH